MGGEFVDWMVGWMGVEKREREMWLPVLLLLSLTLGMDNRQSGFFLCRWNRPLSDLLRLLSELSDSEGSLGIFFFLSFHFPVPFFS